MRTLVKVLKSFPYSVDGITTRTLHEGDVVSVKSELVPGLVGEKLVTDRLDPAPVPPVELPPAPPPAPAPAPSVFVDLTEDAPRHPVRRRRGAPRPAEDASPEAASASADDAPTSEDAEG